MIYPFFCLLNVFTALKGTRVYFLLDILNLLLLYRAFHAASAITYAVFSDPFSSHPTSYVNMHITVT